uniref:Gnk2-homologous domain-containing protein n=1 Tax=Brassica oleracea var. oleracea TaxID=109376 RepID=A0A0D2ZVR6_BRAOL
MGKFPATAATLRIAAVSSLLLLIKSSLTAECTLSQYPNKVYALGLCARGFKSKACLSCLERLTLETQRDCPNIMDSFVWGSDDEDRVSCLVRSSNHSFGNLELSPPVTGISPDQIEPSINMTLFMQQWEYTVNNTLVAATKANTSSVHKYYSAVKAEFTAFPNVYMLTQCTPDITSQDCKQCLEACLKYFREQFRGRTGGMLQEKGSSIPNKKGRSMHRGIITIIVVFTFFNLVVFIGFYKVKSWTRKLNNGTNGKCTLILAPVKLYNDLLG